MGGMNVGGGHGGKKSLDHEIPLIPFIDLLLVCVMFLLATAVWNEMARVNANQRQPGQEAPEDAPPPEETVKLILQIQNSGYVLADTTGTRQVDREAGRKLRPRRAAEQASRAGNSSSPTAKTSSSPRRMAFSTTTWSRRWT